MSTSITTLNTTDSGSTSLSTINTNFTNLNSGKAEVTGQVFTGAISATNLSGTNTGDQINITGNAATATTVTTNANLTGPITSVGNATSITNASIDLTTKVTGILPITNGGTGSATQNFVDLTTLQTIAGQKILSAPLAVQLTSGFSTTVATLTNTAGTTNQFVTTATPEASITAGIGSLATDVNNGIQYIKRANTLGNTGWSRTNGLVYSQTNTVTVANTVTATTLIGAGVGSNTLQANFLKVGDIIRLRAQGVFSRASGTLTLAFRYGATTLMTTPAFTVGNGANNVWVAEGEMTIRSVGAAGTIMGQGGVTFPVFSGAATGSTEMPNLANVTIDTTTANAITCFATWSVAAAGNTISATNINIEVI